MSIFESSSQLSRRPIPRESSIFLPARRGGKTETLKQKLLARKADCSVRWLLNHTALTPWEHGFNGQLSYFDVAAMDSIEGRKL